MIHSSVRRRRRAQKTDPFAPIFSFKKEEEKTTIIPIQSFTSFQQKNLHKTKP
jgi:hypothetical protein